MKRLNQFAVSIHSADCFLSDLLYRCFCSCCCRLCGKISYIKEGRMCTMSNICQAAIKYASLFAVYSQQDLKRLLSSVNIPFYALNFIHKIFLTSSDQHKIISESVTEHSFNNHPFIKRVSLSSLCQTLTKQKIELYLH